MRSWIRGRLSGSARLVLNAVSTKYELHRPLIRGSYDRKTSLEEGQNQQKPDALNQIQKIAKSINLKKNPELESKYAQAKTLERSGLYEEAMLLYKEINLLNPGITKYYHPLKIQFLLKL